MLLEKVKKVKLDNGGEIPAVAEFNNGYTHIVVDDGCWVIVNGGGFSSHVFREAAAILKQLLDSPADYGPYREYINDRSR